MNIFIVRKSKRTIDDKELDDDSIYNDNNIYDDEKMLLADKNSQRTGCLLPIPHYISWLIHAVQLLAFSRFIANPPVS